MRIGIFIPILQENPAGMGVFIYEMISRLIKSHPDCVVFTQDPMATPKWLSGIPAYSSRSRLLPATSRYGFLNRFSRLLWINTSARADFKKYGVDILFSPAQEGAINTSIPHVSVVHDLTPIRFPASYSWLHVFFTKIYAPLTIKKSKSVIAVSKSTKSDLIKYFGLPQERISVVYEGFDKSVFYPPSADEVRNVMELYSLAGQYFFYSGTFSKHKNLVTALLAFSDVKKKFPTIEFVLAGRRDSGDFNEFLDIATSLGLRDSIKMLGYVSRDHLHALLGGCVAYIFPSLFEGFGLAPLEALACGATVISSNTGSLPEVVGSGGILLPPLDVELWVANMIYIAEQNINLDFKIIQKEKAILQASKFCWDHAVHDTLEIISDAHNT